MALKEILFLIAIATIVEAEYVSYENYRVYKIVPSSEKEIQTLVDLKNQNKYMFWTEVIKVEGDVKIMVAPEKQVEFEKYLSSVGIETEIELRNVQEHINNQLHRPNNRNNDNYTWEYYQTLEEINEWLDKVAKEYPDVVTLVTMGSSFEGRFIRGVKIDFKKQANPVIGMIEGGIHAREWISPATVTYIINEFLTSKDPAVRATAENVVWHIFPVTNPDGYVYTFSTNRMWRKNRNTSHFRSCTQFGVSDDISNGIDLNRNFGFLWMSVGASLNPCFETFAGPTEFSEPETQAIRDYVFKIQAEGRLIHYWAFHSYSQMLMVPFSHLGGADVLGNPNYADMYEIAIRGMEKLEAVHGTHYIVGTSKDILYETSGSSDDWARGAADIPIVGLFELRDVGQYGFLLPPEQIKPNNEEVLAGLVEMEKVTRDLGYYHSHSAGQKTVYSFTILILALLINIIG